VRRVLVEKLVAAAKAACMLTFAAFCVLTLIQVINRYALGLQMFWTEEVALILFVWSVMIGLPVTIWMRQEIEVDIIHLKPGLAADLLAGSAWVLSLLFLVLLAIAVLRRRASA